MRANRGRDTVPELTLRSALHRSGLRFRVNCRPLPELRRTADVVFRRARVAVFVDGCFWHACPEHVSWPKANRVWWRSKIEANVRRDRETDRALAEEGWLAIRVWEHEPVAVAASRVRDAVLRRRETHRAR